MVLPASDGTSKVTKEILEHAFELTTNHPTIGLKIRNKWITTDTIIDAIRAAAVIATSMVMTSRLVNTLLPKIPKYKTIDRFDGSNSPGLFQVKYTKQSYYIILQRGEQAEYPLFDKQWKEEVNRMKNLISFRSLKSNNIPAFQRSYDETQKQSSVSQSQANYNINPQNTKKSSQDNQNDSESVASEQKNLVSATFWDSPEAHALFKPRPSDSSCLPALERRIKLLQRAQQHEGWRDLVYGRDPDNICTNYDKLVIRQKSMLILKHTRLLSLK